MRQHRTRHKSDFFIPQVEIWVGPGKALYWWDFCRRDCLNIAQVVTFWLWRMVLVEEGYRKMQVNGPVRQKGSGNKEQQKAEKQRRKWMGKMKLESSSRKSKAGGEPICQCHYHHHCLRDKLTYFIATRYKKLGVSISHVITARHIYLSLQPKWLIGGHEQIQWFLIGNDKLVIGDSYIQLKLVIVMVYLTYPNNLSEHEQTQLVAMDRDNLGTAGREGENS